MTSETFFSRQNWLFTIYFWMGVVSWSLAGLLIFGASLIPPDSSEDTYGPYLMWAGIGIVFVSAVWRYLLRRKLKLAFWDEYARIIGGTTLNIHEKYRRSLVGPVIKDHAQKIRLQRAIKGTYQNRPAMLQEIEVTYTNNLPGKNDAIYRLHYLVQAVKLPAKVPHIFIASKENRIKRLAKPSNLWSLTTKLDESQQLRDLEGDFGKYFDVYTPHLESNDLMYEKEIDALRVLTPDVMITLRDQGFTFDYELCEDYLYVIHEPDLLTAAELENFILSVDTALSELVPQLIGHKFSEDGTKLHIRKSALTMDILLGPFVKPAKLAFILLAIIFAGAFIGSGLQ